MLTVGSRRAARRSRRLAASAWATLLDGRADAGTVPSEVGGPTRVAPSGSPVRWVLSRAGVISVFVAAALVAGVLFVRGSAAQTLDEPPPAASSAAAVTLLRSGVEMAPGSAGSAPTGGLAGGVSGSRPTTSGPTILVHVVGLVRRPGVFRLPSGARVQDALRAAGGVLAGIDTGDVNLAAPIGDGAQLRVRAGGATIVGAAGLSGGVTPGRSREANQVSVVDLNSADQAALEALPGIGPVLAGAILAARAERGGRFSSVEELREVPGVGERTYARLAPLLRVG